jgi:hypothetical protein
MKIENKKKILLVVGAGGSVETNYPSVSQLNKIIENELVQSDEKLSRLYTIIKNILVNKEDRKKKRLGIVGNKLLLLLYKYEEEGVITNLERKDLENEIQKLFICLGLSECSFNQTIIFFKEYMIRKENIKYGMKINKDIEEIINNLTNFEEIAYVCLKLFSYSGYNGKDTPIMESFLDIKDYQNLSEFKGLDFEKLYKKITEIVIKVLSKNIENKENFNKIKEFYEKLKENFEIGIITTNYDSLLYNIFPNFFIGFDKETKEFLSKEVWNRQKWEFLYHIHGSIYNKKIGSDEIIWDEKGLINTREIISDSKQQREGGERIIRQPVIIGYDKQQQIMYNPFKTFFAKLNQLVMEADGVVFIGYGFNDIHLNATFEDFRNTEKKKVVVIDWFKNWKDKDGIIQTDKLKHDSERHRKYCNCFGLYSEYMSMKLQEGEVEYHTKNENPDNINYETIIYKLGLVAATKHIDEIIEFLNDKN